MLINRNKAVFAVSQKKSKFKIIIQANQILSAEDILSQIKEPEGYNGPKLEFILKDNKEENLTGLIDSMLESNVPSKGKIGIFQKNEQEDGDLSKTLVERINENNYQLVEMAEIMNKVNRVKIAPEIANIRIASHFTEWSFKKLIRDLEDCIENDVKIKHRKLSSTVERLLDNPDKLAPFMNKYGIENDQLFEYPLPVMVQSGDQYSINKFNVECDDKYIGSEVIYANVCGKYLEMLSMASRTLLFNPTKKQQDAYQLAFDTQNHLIA